MTAIPRDLPASVLGARAELPRPPAPVLSFDVEDWYQGIEMPARTWDRFEPRLARGLERILGLCAESGVRATFFVLGDIARRHPALVRQIADLGHEVGTHGDDHEKIYNLDPERFRRDLARSLDAIQSATGRAVLGHRAPFFSITRRSLWALDTVREAGLAYDASIYPGPNYRYGIPGYPDEVRRLPNGLLECPVSTFTLFGRPVGIGGAYLRILPSGTLAGALRRRLEDSRPAGLYLHPWEFDPDHPRVRFRPLAMATHYANLRSTEPKLRRLLAEFRFVSYARALGLEPGSA
jgi:polysaccharide deacetylase family protein (PEP-CTERM system associated)